MIRLTNLTYTINPMLSQREQPIDIYSDNPKVTLEYMIAVMLAAKKGLCVQYRDSSWVGVTSVHNPWRSATTSTWDWGRWQFRIAPNSRPKKTVPMECEDYPALFWVREKAKPSKQLLCTGICGSYLYFAQALPSFLSEDVTTYALSGLNVADPRPCEYSIDRKEWKPCTKEVSE